MPLPKVGLTENQVKEAVEQQIASGLQLAGGFWKQRVTEADTNYRGKFKKGLATSQKAMIASAYEQAKIILQGKGQSLESIQSAALKILTGT